MILPIGSNRKPLGIGATPVFVAHQLAGFPIDKVELRTSWAIDALVFISLGS